MVVRCDAAHGAAGRATVGLLRRWLSCGCQWFPPLIAAVGALAVAACWSSTGTEAETGPDGDEAAAEGGADFEACVDDAALEDAFVDSDAVAPDEGSIEDGEDVVEDADGDGWPPLPGRCLDWGVFPPGSVGCIPPVPRCPEEFSYCCHTSRCGSLEFGATGCCGSSDCGDPGGYGCIEVIGDSTPRVCTRPEPEFRCPAERPYCCFNFDGAAVCADHALFRWTSCENQWATGGGS